MLKSSHQYFRAYLEEISKNIAVGAGYSSAISPTTRKALNFLILMGRLTIIIPWRWDPGTGRMRKPDRFLFKLWRVQACFHIIQRLGLIAYVFVSVVIRPIPAYEIFLAIWNLGIQTITVIFLMVALNPSLEFEVRSIINSSFRFNKLLNYSRDLKLKSKLCAETENLMIVLVLGGTFLVLGVGPSGAYLLSTGRWKLGWILNYLEFPFMYFLLGIYASYFYVMDATVITWVAVGTVMYSDIMSGWLEKLKELDTEILGAEAKAQNRRIQIIFRAHQVLHRQVEGITYFFLPIIVSLLLIVCITVLYSVFGLYPVLNSLILISCAILGGGLIIMFKFICNMCGKFTINSVTYRESFERNVNRNPKKSKVDKLFFKSIQPIAFHIGPYEKFSNSIFQPILTNVVVNWVINLLLSLDRPTKR